MICPVAICTIEHTANAEDPPPEGSTASMKWFVLYRESWPIKSTGICARGPVRRRSTFAEGKALLDASAAMPMDSRKL